MTDERRLEELMQAAGDSLAVPEDGPARILRAAAGDQVDEHLAPVTSLRRRRGQWLGAVAAAVVVLVGVAVMSRPDRSTGQPTAGGAATTTAAGAPTFASAQQGSPTTTRAAVPAAGAAAPSATRSSAESGGATSAAATDASATRLVSVGTIELAVAASDRERVLDQIAAIAVDAGGLISDRTGSAIEARVPASAYEGARARIRTLGAVVDDRSEDRDVGPAYQSLADRIAALETQPPTPERDADLQRLREERAALEDQIALATLRITISPA